MAGVDGGSANGVVVEIGVDVCGVAGVGGGECSGVGGGCYMKGGWMGIGMEREREMREIVGVRG